MISKQQREYGILAVLVLGIIFVAYSFLKPKPVPVNDTTAILPSASSPAAPSGNFLPYGTKLDTGILNDSRFKSLTAPTYPTVTPSEIGSDNIFGK